VPDRRTDDDDDPRERQEACVRERERERERERDAAAFLLFGPRIPTRSDTYSRSRKKGGRGFCLLF